MGLARGAGVGLGLARGGASRAGVASAAGFRAVKLASEKLTEDCGANVRQERGGEVGREARARLGKEVSAIVPAVLGVAANMGEAQGVAF